MLLADDVVVRVHVDHNEISGTRRKWPIVLSSREFNDRDDGANFGFQVVDVGNRFGDGLFEENAKFGFDARVGSFLDGNHWLIFSMVPAALEKYTAQRPLDTQLLLPSFSDHGSFEASDGIGVGKSSHIIPLDRIGML